MYPLLDFNHDHAVSTDPQYEDDQSDPEYYRSEAHYFDFDHPDRPPLGRQAVRRRAR